MTLLYLPSAFSQASECLTRDCEPGSDTWGLRIAPFSTLSGKLTEPQSWRRAWKKAPWMRHLSGPTFAPSMQELGLAKWISSLPDSHAKTSLSPAGASGSTASGPDFSLRLSGSPPIAMRGASFWRTSQASLVPPPPLWTKPKALSMNARPPESWENWPTAGGIRNGSLFLRPTWAPVMAELAGSVLHGENWEAPKANERSGRQTNSGGQAHLDVQANTWASLRATDGTKGGPNQRGSKGDLMLPSMAAQWPTPAAQQYGGTAEQHLARKAAMAGGARKTVTELNAFVGQWPTPAARDFKSPIGGAATMNHFNRPSGPSLPAFIEHSQFSPLARATHDGLESLPTIPTSPRHLNPLFGAWLMGWPSTWVIAEPHASSALETELWRSTLQQHLSCLLGDPACSKESDQ